jgi:hypothetical protein
MTTFKRCASYALAVLILIGAAITLDVAPARASVIVGTANDANCYPYDCFSGEYQQVYSASAFSGTTSFNQIIFFNTIYQPGTATLSTATYTISFSITSAAVNGLSGTFANNIGSNSQVFFSGIAGGSSLSFTGANYTYNPLAGNLLIDIKVTNITSNGHGYLDADNSGSVTSRLYGAGAADSNGIVTQFGTATPVPEPASILLFGAGLVGVALLRRKTAFLR